MPLITLEGNMPLPRTPIEYQAYRDYCTRLEQVTQLWMDTGVCFFTVGEEHIRAVVTAMAGERNLPVIGAQRFFRGTGVFGVNIPYVNILFTGGNKYKDLYVPFIVCGTECKAIRPNQVTYHWKGSSLYVACDGTAEKVFLGWLERCKTDRIFYGLLHNLSYAQLQREWNERTP